MGFMKSVRVYGRNRNRREFTEEEKAEAGDKEKDS